MALNRLLIIDDDPDVRALFRIFAETFGYAVTEGGNGTESLIEYDRVIPSVIILDLSMPEQDGVQILRELATRGCATPIILASGHNERVLSATQRLGSELGLNMAMTLTKPVSENALRAALSRTWNHAFVPTGGELEKAILSGELVVHYQPKIDLQAKEAPVVGSEALVRWMHPQKGLQLPENFLSVAEQSGLTGELTDVVLEQVIAQLGEWFERDLNLPVAINLSTAQLTELDLPDRLEERMLDAGLDPALLQFEITEQTNLPDSSKVIDILARMRLKGFGITLDDFGAGYSSIAEIYRLPLTEVKVHESITVAAETDHDARKVMTAIVDLVHSFDIKVCAEGVESERSADFLRSIGCDKAQGHYFSRSLPPVHFRHYSSKMRLREDELREILTVA